MFNNMDRRKLIPRNKQGQFTNIKRRHHIVSCACGCGEKIITPDKRGRERRYIKGHVWRGRKWQPSKETIAKLVALSKKRIREKNPTYKGRIKRKGYWCIYKPEHPLAQKQGYISEHRLIMEKHIGRYLKPEEVVHHINGIKDDNRIENLMLFANQKEHIKYHKKLLIEEL